MISRRSLLLIVALLMATPAGGVWWQTVAAQATPSAASPAPSGNEPAYATLLMGQVEALPPAPIIIGLARWTFDPGAEADFTVPGPELYVVETGSITLLTGEPAGTSGNTAATPSPGAATPTHGRVLMPGDQAVIAANDTHALHNDGSKPATVINVISFPASYAIPSWLPSPETPPGVHIENLAADVLSEPTALPAGPAVITLDRTTLPPRTTQHLPQDIAYGLVVVDSGALKLATESASGGEKPVGPREVARFEGEPQAVLRNTSNDIAVAWVLTISAGKQTSATPAAATPSSD